MAFPQLFQADDYIEVVRLKLDDEGRRRGYRSELATAAGCQPAYLSHVLSGKAHFTLDHAAGICSFWNLEDLESQYFMSLVSLARAGSSALKNHLTKRLKGLRLEHIKSHRTRFSHQPDHSERLIEYFRDWLVAAVHASLHLPNIKRENDLAKRFGIDRRQINECLQLLTDLGFIEKSEQGWTPTSQFFHLAELNEYACLHHKNWRTQAEKSYVRPLQYPDNYHYTSLYVLSKEDFRNLTQDFAKTVKSLSKKLMTSQEETIGCLNIDWFEI